MVDRRRGGRDEADCGADDRGDALLGGARTDHDTGDLCADEEAGSEEGETEVFGDEALTRQLSRKRYGRYGCGRAQDMEGFRVSG